MSASLAKAMTLEAFLDWERAQELRYEYDGTQPVAMTGGTVAHSVIATNIVRALDDRLPPQCRVFRGDLKIVVAGRVRYPDAVVTCALVPDDADVVPEPAVVFEVLSSSTALIDRNIKAAEYRATPSVQHYVMLEQTRAEATVLTRDGDDWVEHRLLGVEARLLLPELGLEVPLAEFYHRVRLGA